MAVFVVVGFGGIFLPVTHYEAKEEAWMESVIARDVPGFTYLADVKMGDIAYQVLQPFGIVGRRYIGRDGRAYEITVIAGNSRKSFHDPQICFSAQNWELEDPSLVMVDIPAMGGEVPATVIGLKGTAQRGTTMYFYKTALGLYHDSFYVPFAIAIAKLAMKEEVDTQFYRFIVTPAGKEGLDADIEALEAFAQATLSETAKSKGGEYFVVSR